MAEYIERKALLRAIKNSDWLPHERIEAMKMVREQPTVDAVPVVRCRDCKYFTEGMAIGMCKRDPLKPIMPMPYDNYCGFGERKDGE